MGEGQDRCGHGGRSVQVWSWGEVRTGVVMGGRSGRCAEPAWDCVTCSVTDKENRPGQESSARLGFAFPSRRPGLVPKDVTRTKLRASQVTQEEDYGQETLNSSHVPASRWNLTLMLQGQRPPDQGSTAHCTRFLG